MNEKRLQELLNSNYDWADLPGLGPEKPLENDWAGDLPGFEYSDYNQNAAALIDTSNEPVQYNFNKNNHPEENGIHVSQENISDVKVDEDMMYEPDMYYFDYQADGPSKRKQELTSSLLDVAVSPNSTPKESSDTDSGGELSQSSQLSQSRYDAYSSSNSYENEYVQSDYGNDYYGNDDNTGKGVWVEETDLTGGLRPKNPRSDNQAGYALEDLVMQMITRTEKDLTKVLTYPLPDKSVMEYDLIEWHFQPPTGQEDKKLDLHSVISGESNELSYLVLLSTAPDGLYHFNLKLGDTVRNATVFNVATVKHESTCACLTGRNLFSTQDTELVEPKFMLREDIPKDGIEKEIANIAEKASSSSNEDLAQSVAKQISTPDQKYECIVSDHPILSPHAFHEVQVKSSKYVACFMTCTITEPVISGFWNINFTLCSGPQAEGGACLRASQLMMEECNNFLSQNCFCAKGDENVTFMTKRNHFGLSTDKYYYDIVGQYLLYNLCNKC